MSEHHRPLPEIDAERAHVAARMIELQIERDAARQAQIDTITRLFDAGLSLREIAREMRQTPAAVQGVLFRSGRTEGGRAAIRRQIDSRFSSMRGGAAAARETHNLEVGGASPSRATTSKAAARVPPTTTAEQATVGAPPPTVAASPKCFARDTHSGDLPAPAWRD